MLLSPRDYWIKPIQKKTLKADKNQNHWPKIRKC